MENETFRTMTALICKRSNGNNTFCLQNCSFEEHEILDLKTQEMFVNVESNNGAGAIIASVIIILTLSLTIYGTVSMYCYDPTCPVPCI